MSVSHKPTRSGWEPLNDRASATFLLYSRRYNATEAKRCRATKTLRNFNEFATHEPDLPRHKYEKPRMMIHLYVRGSCNIVAKQNSRTSISNTGQLSRRSINDFESPSEGSDISLNRAIFNCVNWPEGIIELRNTDFEEEEHPSH